RKLPVTRRPSASHLVIAGAAGGAGYAIHVLLPDVLRLFAGRIFTLPVAILFGPWYGLAAAAIGALPVLRLSPIFFGIIAIEAVIVGLFAERGKSSIAGGAIVWVGTALALAAAPRWFSIGYPQSTVWSLALQQVLNGMVAVVVAELVSVGISS